MTAEDMAARAQQLRRHGYAMAGQTVPKHAVPPIPVVTSVVAGGLIAWRGSAGATHYSMERYDAAARSWRVLCDKCATEAEDPWIDLSPTPNAQYRVTAFNADGMPSPTSTPY